MVSAGLWIAAGLIIIGFLAAGGGRVFHLWLQEPVGMAVPLLAGVIVLGAPQIADMMGAMKTGYGPAGLDHSWWHQTGLGCGVLLLGLQSWFWNRAALNARCGYRDRQAPPNLPWQEIWAPRLTLVPATLIAVWPMVKAIEGDIPWSSVPWAGVVSAMIACCLLWTLARRRRQLHDARADAAARSAHTQSADELEIVVTGIAASRLKSRPLPSWRVSQLFAAAPFGSSAAWTMLVLGVLGVVIAEVAPDLVNDNLHALTASLIALSCLVAVASVVLALLRDLAELALDRLQRLLVVRPVVTAPAADVLGAALMIALPLGGSYLADAAGLYNLRHIPDSRMLVVSRPDIATAAKAYIRCHANETARIPAIIVAAEGGASRSAAWTLSVMRMLDARTGGAFGTHLFAVIGVSGGSLGAMTYALAQRLYFPPSQAAPAPERQVAFWDSPKVAKGLVELARADLLSPAIARLFTSDVLLGLPQRGPALEQAFEHHWRWEEGFDLGGAAAAGFLAVRNDQPCLPHLILSGTEVRTGDRLLTSSLAFAPPRDGPEEDTSEPTMIHSPFPAAVDVLSLVNADIPAATAVLNSARFPLISPPGRVPRDRQTKRDLEVIDGGVYENYGARTARELADAIRAEPRIEPIVVLISNDVEHRADEELETRCRPESTAAQMNRAMLAALKRTGENRSGVWVPEFLTSALGLYKTRGAHARSEIVVLLKQMCDKEPWHLFHFDLPKPDVSEAQAAPMNWALDPNSCQFMLGAARRAPFNAEQADSLRESLGQLAVGDEGDRAAEDSVRCGGSAVPLRSSEVGQTASNG